MTDKISSVIAHEGNGNIQITFTIPSGVIKKAQDETIAELARDIEIPGFRKGMAPITKAAEKIPESTLIEHSLSHILPQALAEAINENKLKIAVYPKFELISAKKDEDWQIRAITCELPEVILGDYKKNIAGASRASKLWTPDKGKPEEKKELSRDEKEGIVIKALLDNVKVTIPDILVEEEANGRLSNLLARIEKLGLTLEGYLASIGKKPDEIRADYAKQAREAIALDLILSKVAEAEGIKVDQKEIEKALSISQASAQKGKETEEELASRKRLLESILKRRGALDFLINLS